MNFSNEMIFRYDNSKHYPNLKTFPHHKHLPQSVIESNEPQFNSILAEIEILVMTNKNNDENESRF